MNKCHSFWVIQNIFIISKIVTILLFFFNNSAGIWPMCHPLISVLSIPRNKDKVKPRVKGFWLRKNSMSHEGCWNSRRVMSPRLYSCRTCWHQTSQTRPDSCWILHANLFLDVFVEFLIKTHWLSSSIIC